MAAGIVALVISSCTQNAWKVGEVAPMPTVAGDTIVAAAGPLEQLASAPPPLEREFRGVWVSPVENGEWPSKKGLDSEQQQEELKALFDRVQDLGLNAVIFHVRTGADALYPSRKAPWSAYLTGQLGRAPSPEYDPVAFAIEQAHARGLQFHAWFNPFRISPPMAQARSTAGAVATEHPEWVIRYGDQLWIDPGNPQARRAVLDAIVEVVDRYDIDAVHLDDYFYPYLEEHAIRKRVKHGHHWRRITVHETIKFADNTSWKKFGKADGWTERDAWRRANIDGFIEQLYREVKARKRWVEVGISPFGIWRPDHPEGISGLDAYNEIYADSRKWLREGWVDYLAPQLYWRVDGEQHRFTRLDAWWRSENKLDRHIWPGMFTAGAATRSGNWPVSDIVRAVDTLRVLHQKSGESLGHVHFRLKSLLADAPGDVGDRLRARVYQQEALPPASPWLGPAVPALPKLFPGSTGTPIVADASRGAVLEKGAPSIEVQAGDDVPVRWWALQLRDAAGHWTTSIHPAGERILSLALPDGSAPTAAAITAISRTGVASGAAPVPLPKE